MTDTATLPLNDIRGIDALIAELDRRVRQPGSYTSQEAGEFVRRWRAARAQGNGVPRLFPRG